MARVRPPRDDARHTERNGRRHVARDCTEPLVVPYRTEGLGEGSQVAE
jgi:hypothetical protein